MCLMLCPMRRLVLRTEAHDEQRNAHPPDETAR